jgi:hypothetical protein
LSQIKGENGPEDNDCLEIAKCHQIMVDSGKQGKCIAFSKLKEFKNIYRQLEIDNLDQKNVNK